MKDANLDPAFILHRRPYSNTSLLLECFTASYGRFPAIAKGVSAGRVGANGVLQVFSPLLIGWRGKGEVKTLTTFEPNGFAIKLEGRALYCGFYVNELLMRLLERDDPHAELYALYIETLKGISLNHDVEPVLRRFERLLLAELGYGLVLAQEAEAGEQIDPDCYYRYEVERGPIRVKPGAVPCMSGRTLLALANGGPLDNAGRKEARLLMRQVLSHYLGDKPLKSRELFQLL